MRDLLRQLRESIVLSDLVTQFVGTALLAAGGFLLTRLWRERIHVKRLKQSDDADFEAFYDICRDSFEDDELEPKSEMARYLDEGQAAGSNQSFEDYFAVLKRGAEVCGVINATIYPKEHIGFINYVALHMKDPRARHAGALPLLSALGKRMKSLNCRAVLYEIETLRSDVSPHENEKSVGRAQLFIRMTQRAGAKTYEVPVAYAQPELSIIEGYRYSEVPLSLMYVALDGQPPSPRKQDLSRLLEVVFLQWYLDVYHEPGPARAQYERYLREMHARLVATLPDSVELAEAGRGWRPPLREGRGAPPRKGTRGLSPARKRRVSRAALQSAAPAS